MSCLPSFVLRILKIAFQKRTAKTLIYVSVICFGLFVSISSAREIASADGGKLAQATTSIYFPIIENGTDPITPIEKIVAKVETDPVPSSGDAADDAAIWVHPTDPSLSLVIGTDKDSGLLVYDLAGNELQYLADGRLNNVDVRYKYSFGEESIDIVTASNRSNDSIAVYRVNPSSRTLENIAGPGIAVGIEVYGACMYKSPDDGKFYTYVNSESGEVEQWELIDDGSGEVVGSLVREFDVGSQTEGCVADDEMRYLYIGEESQGIWKYGAEPGDGETRTMVDTTGSGGHLTADVEGLTIYYASGESGYLIASSQGSDEFVIYERQGDNKYVTTFEIEEGDGIDGVSNTDGIDVASFSLGSIFPQGVFVAQDGNNDVGNQNFKLVPWQLIANSVNPPLIIDTSKDPRG